MMRKLDITIPLPFNEQKLEQSFQQSKNAIERSHWHILWLLFQGFSAREIIEMTQYSALWVYEIARRYERIHAYNNQLLTRQVGENLQTEVEIEDICWYRNNLPNNYRLKVITDGSSVIIYR